MNSTVGWLSWTRVRMLELLVAYFFMLQYVVPSYIGWYNWREDCIDCGLYKEGIVFPEKKKKTWVQWYLSMFIQKISWKFSLCSFWNRTDLIYVWSYSNASITPCVFPSAAVQEWRWLVRVFYALNCRDARANKEPSHLKVSTSSNILHPPPPSH